MKVLKRNQIIIFVLAIMLVTAGYLSTTENNNGEAYMASSKVAQRDTNDVSSIGDATLVNGGALVDNDKIENNIGANNVVQITSAKNTEDDYFSASRLERDNMYSQQLDSYQKMIDSTTITNEQKAIAEKEIKRINDNKNAIMIIENLVKTKGFKDIVVFINGDSINAVIKAEKLGTQEIAQIQNIISRELNADIANIHISNK